MEWRDLSSTIAATARDDGRASSRFLAASSCEIAVETEIFARYVFGEQNDLIGVAGKVFDDVKDRREHGRVVSLDS